MSSSSQQYFNIAIASIFAREVLEGSIIIINYRTVIRRSSSWEGEREKEALQTVTRYSIYAAFLAVLCILAIAVILQLFSRSFDDKYAKVIEAISKIVAAICILQISLKIPTWLGMYPKKHGDIDVGVTLKKIKFNISWNLWREVAECGIFLLPFFLLNEGAIAIPLSALVGILTSLILAFGANLTSRRLENKFWLTLFMSSLTALLALGLFVGGCHLLEVVFGTTPIIWKIEKPFWSDNRFPMTILKPFGYTSSRTVLQLCAFWIWSLITLGFHYRKYRFAKSRRDATNFDASNRQQDEPTSSYSESESDQKENYAVENGDDLVHT